MNEKYDQLKSVIQAANPEIMELKFGCEVEMHDRDFAEPGYGITGNEMGKGVVIEFSPGGPVAESNDEYDDSARVYSYSWGIVKSIDGLNTDEPGGEDFYIILGRPIRLADVLLAIDKARKNIFVRHDGVLFKWERFNEGGSGHHGVESTYVEWNIKDDNLDNQSEETKQFLINLLVTSQTNE